MARLLAGRFGKVDMLLLATAVVWGGSYVSGQRSNSARDGQLDACIQVYIGRNHHGDHRRDSRKQVFKT